MTDFTKPVQVEATKGVWSDGKVVYVFDDVEALVVWNGNRSARFHQNDVIIRNTPPAPELVQFDRESVPKGALWRNFTDDKWWSHITEYGVVEVVIGSESTSYEDLLRWQYSLDNGATWHKAGRVRT